MASVAHMEFDGVTVEYTRKKWFLNLQKVIRFFIKKPTYVYLGEKPCPGSIILSNHESATVPLTLEMYGKMPVRFWGAHDMNEGFRAVYRYQTVTYYHGKKHWPLWCARLFCLLASPLTMIFYRGLELIATYPDMRFKNTLSRSITALEKKNTLVVFPEDSSDGYHKVLKRFLPGAIMLLEQCRRHKMDLPVYVAYYQKDKRVHVFDKPVMLSKLLAQGLSREALSAQLCQRCNELGQMEF